MFPTDAQKWERVDFSSIVSLRNIYAKIAAEAEANHDDEIAVPCQTAVEDLDGILFKHPGNPENA